MLPSINILGLKKICFLSHTSDYIIGMIPINNQEERSLDKIKDSDRGGYSIDINHPIKDIKYVIPKDNILLYGGIDINNDDDLEVLYSFHDFIVGKYNKIRTNVDYTTGEVLPKNGKYMFAETFDLVCWLKYNLLMLGYPEKVLIFKTIKKKYSYV